MLFQQELVFQVLQFLYFFKDTVLIIYQIQIMDDLLLDFNQVMVRVIQLEFYVTHHIPHLHIHRHPEENRLSIVYQFLAFTNQQGNIISFLVKPDKFGFLYLVIRFVLISIIHVPLQVHHVADSSQGYIFQATFHFPLIIVLALFVIFL